MADCLHLSTDCKLLFPWVMLDHGSLILCSQITQQQTHHWIPEERALMMMTDCFSLFFQGLGFHSCFLIDKFLINFTRRASSQSSKSKPITGFQRKIKKKKLFL
jgi:hypothetical protein